jgi:hypothetical protein
VVGVVAAEAARAAASNSLQTLRVFQILGIVVAWHTTATDDHPDRADRMTGAPDPTATAHLIGDPIGGLIGALTVAAIGRIARDPPINLDPARRDR